MSLNVNSQPQDTPAGADEFLGLALPRSQSHAVEMLVDAYLTQLDPDALPEPKKITNDLLYMIEHQFVQYNKNADAGSKWKILHELPPAAIAMVMLRVYKIRCINFAGLSSDREHDLLGIYQEWGENEGIYATGEADFWILVWNYNGSLDSKGVNEVINRLKKTAERVECCQNPDLVPVNNGIFNYKTKTLEPFSPDIVFTAKCPVDYNPAAKSPVITNPDGTAWEIESWIKDLFETGSDIPETIWEIIGAVVRPNTRWGKCALFLSVAGCNGKGTLCQLMRNLAGKNSHASIPLSDFGKEFLLEPLIGKTSIITDENDVGTYIDKAANLKSIITNDVVAINRKHREIIYYRFSGVMIQCVNQIPRVKDRSDSFFRRQLCIPFTKSFTGCERKYIKDDYLNRTDVLEYVLHRVLNMNYYELSIPESCMEAMEEMKTYNDPVRDFVKDVLPEARLNCIQNQLIYDLYKGWMKKNNPNGSVQGKQTFLNDLKNLPVLEDLGWQYHDKKTYVKTEAIVYEEPLLDKYDCTDWMQNSHSTNRSRRITLKNIPHYIRGLFRIDIKADTGQFNGMCYITED